MIYCFLPSFCTCAPLRLATSFSLWAVVELGASGSHRALTACFVPFINFNVSLYHIANERPVEVMVHCQPHLVIWPTKVKQTLKAGDFHRTLALPPTSKRVLR
jgi:hypothetical protein